MTVIFLQKFQKQKPENVVLAVNRKIFANKFDTNVGIVKKSQDFAENPVLCYTILQLVIVKNKTDILAI